MFRLLERFLYRILPFKHFPDRECRHMKNKISDLSDDTATGISRWYTERHMAGCPGCLSTLQGLRRLRARLLGLGESDSHVYGEAEDKLTLSPDRWQAVTESWKQADERVEIASSEGGKERG